MICLSTGEQCCPHMLTLGRIEALTARFESSYSLDIIGKTPSSYDVVIIEADGTWRTEDNKYGTAWAVSAAPLGPSLDGRASSTSDTSSKSKLPSTGVTILDEAWPRTNGCIKRSSTAHISLGSSPAPGGMIDLTVSSDEEAEAEAEASEVVAPSPARMFADIPAAQFSKRRIEDDEEDGPSENGRPWVRRRIDDSFEDSSMWTPRL
jgi:hypothetical protein